MWKEFSWNCCKFSKNQNLIKEHHPVLLTIFILTASMSPVSFRVHFLLLTTYHLIHWPCVTWEDVFLHFASWFLISSFWLCESNLWDWSVSLTVQIKEDLVLPEISASSWHLCCKFRWTDTKVNILEIFIQAVQVSISTFSRRIFP